MTGLAGSPRAAGQVGVQRQPQIITMLATSWIMTDMPAALTEVFQFRTIADLSAYSQARLSVGVNTVGTASSEIRAQYSLDQSTWNYLDTGTGPAANISATGVRTSGWVSLVAAARADVYLRLVSINGDGVADPQIRLVTLQLR